MGIKFLVASTAALLLAPGAAVLGVATLVGPATACKAPSVQNTPVGSDALQVTLSHANIKASLPAAAHTADLGSVVASRPDFVTLNETYFRTDAELRPTGYASFRAHAPFDAREAPVLWRADSWQLVDSGTQLMHDRAVKWGTRYANWVTLASTQDGTTVSVIAAHASPGGPGRDGLLREFAGQLDALITTLEAKGPVLVGADLNTHYPDSGFLRDWLAGSGATSTFDVLGEPTGGWATGDGGGVIDYILTAGAVRPISHATAALAHSDHRSLTATMTVTRPVTQPVAAPLSAENESAVPPEPPAPNPASTPEGEQDCSGAIGNPTCSPSSSPSRSPVEAGAPQDAQLMPRCVVPPPINLPDGFAGALITVAASQLGLPYVWGGGDFDGPTGGGFDCSGLVLYAAYQASEGRVRLPHYSGDQIRAGAGVAWDDKRPGDLLFFGYPGAGAPHHVAIFIGGDQILHAPHTGDQVRYGTLDEFAGQVMTVRRLA